MATGDAAAAQGLPVIPSTKDLKLGYNDINAVSDALADHQTSGTHTIARVVGLTTALAAKVDKTSIVVSLTQPVGQAENGIWIKPSA